MTKKTSSKPLFTKTSKPLFSKSSKPLFIKKPKASSQQPEQEKKGKLFQKNPKPLFQKKEKKEKIKKSTLLPKKKEKIEKIKVEVIKKEKPKIIRNFFKKVFNKISTLDLKKILPRSAEEKKSGTLIPNSGGRTVEQWKLDKKRSYDILDEKVDLYCYIYSVERSEITDVSNKSTMEVLIPQHD